MGRCQQSAPDNELAMAGSDPSVPAGKAGAAAPCVVVSQVFAECYF